jgi:hypothetical protein
VHVSRSVRAGGALGHLLLVVVLALGVFVMHTVGHPGQSSEPGMSAAAHASTPHAPAAAQDPTEAPASLEQAHTTRSTHASPNDKPAMAMNMFSLCMAVMFGAWALAALLRMAFARRADWPTKFLAEAPVVLRPNPLPRGPDLTQLSVLRL